MSEARLARPYKLRSVSRDLFGSLLKRPATITRTATCACCQSASTLIRQGTCGSATLTGHIHVFGERLPGPDVAIHLHDRKLYNKLFINPNYTPSGLYGRRADSGARNP
jgi:hypothetical protein